MKALVVTTTTATREDAEVLAAALVERRLAACVQLSAIDSVYRWQGKVERAGEVLLTIKTRADLYDAVEAAILELHAYETPEVMAMGVTAGSADYLAWIGAETEE